jgi:hypothetical protein
MTIPLKSGSRIIMNEDSTGERIIFMMRGLSISAEVIEANEELRGTEAWANREIELYEQALKIDLQAEREFVTECLINAVLNKRSE